MVADRRRRPARPGDLRRLREQASRSRVCGLHPSADPRRGGAGRQHSARPGALGQLPVPWLYASDGPGWPSASRTSGCSSRRRNSPRWKPDGAADSHHRRSRVGKTTLAYALAQQIGGPVISRDAIKEGMVAAHPGFRTSHRRPADPADLRRVLRGTRPAAEGRGDGHRRSGLRPSRLGKAWIGCPHSRLRVVRCLVEEPVARPDGAPHGRIAPSCRPRRRRASRRQDPAMCRSLWPFPRSMWTRPTGITQSWPPDELL